MGVLVLRAEEVEVLKKVVESLDVIGAAFMAEVFDSVAKRAEKLLKNDDFGRGLDDANVFQQRNSWLDQGGNDGESEALVDETQKVGDQSEDVQISEGTKKTIHLGMRINARKS